MTRNQLRARYNAERRVHRLLRKHKLFFFYVGAYANHDRVIPMYNDDGLINDEYDGILREIVAAARRTR